MIKYSFPFLLIISVLGTACEKKFLEPKQTGHIILSDTRDYDLLLNSDELIAMSDFPLLMLGDDVQTHATRRNSDDIFFALYTWRDDIYGDANPALWSMVYKSINVYNIILDEIEKAAGGTVAEKKILQAEAKLGRAFCHFLVLNLFAKHYDKATAAADHGIPYITSTDMYAPNPGRSTVQLVYNKLIADVNEAIPDLLDKSTYNFRGSKLAAFAFLSRVYLFMGNYELAVENADKAMEIYHSISNYRTAGFRKPGQVSDPELIYFRTHFERYTSYLRPSASLLAVLPTTDVRKRLFAPSANSLSNMFTLVPGITCPEVLLNKAEALLRMQTPDTDAALSLLNQLHALRDNAHTDFVTSDVQQALTWVLDERRREMINSGLRFLDMRRLEKEGRIPAVTRSHSGMDYTLEPGSKKYTLQVPRTVIGMNPGMPQNDR